MFSLKEATERNELLRTTINSTQGLGKVNTLEDDAEIYGKSWVASFRKLSGTEQKYTKKAIEDILLK